MLVMYIFWPVGIIIVIGNDGILEVIVSAMASFLCLFWRKYRSRQDTDTL